MFKTIHTACLPMALAALTALPSVSTQATTVSPETLVAVDMTASITRTDYGVPHISADNLSSLGFGNGYAQAQDHICTLADGYTRVNSEYSKYFGADKYEAGDSLNLVTDFGYKAMRLRSQAEAAWPGYSDDAKQLINGYSAGYNHYLGKVEQGDATLPTACRDQPWVRRIDPHDVVTYLFYIGSLAGEDRLKENIFFANPGDSNEWKPSLALPPTDTARTKSPRPPAAAEFDFAQIGQSIAEPDRALGSNAWGLGSEMTDNGRGLLLGNPHYPNSGQLRFWQSHATIPGDLNVSGASLLGMPGLINIGFNENVAWSNTVSYSDHMVIYQLALDPSDRTRYLVDGVSKAMEIDTYTIDVKTDAGTFPFQKTVYYTDLGPVVEAPGLLPWDDQQAFVIKDVNSGNIDNVDFTLAMNRSKNLSDFQQAHKDYDGTLFSNTVYADKEGNAFFIDDSTVPNLSPLALHLITTDPELIALRKKYGFTLLPGHLSALIYNDATPYEATPKMVRRDYVQNSNDSFWATNPEQLLSGYSPLYGDREQALKLRTRLSLKMLSDSAGEDNRFSRAEVEQALFSNRSYLAELILPELLQQCAAQGEEPVELTDTMSVDIRPGCYILSQWNYQQTHQRLGTHLFREFSGLFNQETMLSEPFDIARPAITPAKLAANPEILKALALSMLNLYNAGFDLQETSGDIQFVERTQSDGNPTGIRYPWPGESETEGGFNIIYAHREHAAIAPLHNYEQAINLLTQAPLESNLSKEGYLVRHSTSWVMVVGFDDTGPVARGLLTMSQSMDPESVHYSDQTEIYSSEQRLRPILFKPEEIARHTLTRELISTLPECPTPTPPTPGTDTWDASSIYYGGDIVSHDQMMWQARFWTKGTEPSVTAPQYQWKLISDHPVNWVAAVAYPRGSIVQHNSHSWTAKFWSEGEEPSTDSPAWQQGDKASCI